VQAATEAIAQAYQGYVAELKLAGPHWERKPAAGGEGEEAWCARQVAEHVAGAATFFGAGIAGGMGVEGPARMQSEFASVAAAIPGTEKAHAALMGVVNQMSDEQLAIELDAPRLGKRSLGEFLGIIAYHLTDHAGQLKTLRGG